MLLESLSVSKKTQNLLVFSFPIVSFGAFSFYQYLVFRWKRKIVGKELNAVEKERLVQRQKDALSDVIKLYGSSLAFSCAFETVASHLEWNKSEIIGPFVGHVHVIFPLAVSYVLQKQSAHEFTISSGEKELLTSANLTKDLKAITHNKYLWFGVTSVLLLQISTRTVLPYMADHEEQYSDSFLLRNIIKFYKWKYPEREQALEATNNVTIRILNSILRSLISNLSSMMFSFCEERVWKDFLQSRMREEKIGATHSFIASKYMWISWRSTILLQRFKYFHSVTDLPAMLGAGTLISVSSLLSVPVDNYLNKKISNNVLRWFVVAVLHHILPTSTRNMTIPWSRKETQKGTTSDTLFNRSLVNIAVYALFDVLLLLTDNINLS
jgi:hypothetical protein